ncbi:MAG: type II secretion system minor pseudopilin GspI [Deltaproteobacteria bacterium]|nr:type II secretion system minor pseudopilin GspI [Deltaproteobacteria bacterium]
MFKKTSGSRGFTLLEVMVALAVLAIALTAVVKNQGDAADALGEARLRLRAAWLAQDKMAELQTSGIESEALPEGEFEKEDAGFRWKAFVSVPPGFPMVEKVAVRVFWGLEDSERYVELVGFH